MPTSMKYTAFARMALRQVVRHPADLIGRMVFMVVIVAVFAAVWRAAVDGGLAGFESAALVWYLAVTEWILLSVPVVHREIEDEIHRGDFAHELLRPYSYEAALCAQGIGAIAVRAPAVGATAFGTAFVLTREVPTTGSLVAVALIGPIAMLVIYGLYVLVGFTAFWLKDVSPIFWVGQKLLFIFGGLILPLSLYPPWMQQLAGLTPFPYVLAGPGRLVLGNAMADLWRLMLPLTAWALVVALLVRGVFRRGTDALCSNGG